MERLVKGDQVVVTVGKDRGKQGEILRRVEGGKNLALLNPASGKGDKVGFKFLEDGRKVRVFKSNGETVGA